MVRYIFLLIAVLFFSLSCKNIAEFSADKNSTEALLFEMQEYINNFQYDDAISVFDSMTSKQQSTRRARELYASSYMGKCGFEFVDFVNDISDNNDSATPDNLFLVLLRSMEDSTATHANDCRLAEGIIDTNISSLNPVKSTEYNMSLLNGLAKLGTIMNVYGADANNNLDAGFDPCNTGDITDTDVTQMVTGLTRVLAYIDDSSLSFLGGAFDNICDVGEPLEQAGMCDPVDTADVTAGQICAMRALMNESDTVGLSTCTGDIAACACGGCPL